MTRDADSLTLSSVTPRFSGVGSFPLAIPDYQLLRPIGQGSYGQVWLARSVTGVLRAVKIVYRASFDDDRPYEREFEGIKKFEPISQARETQVAIFHVGRKDTAGFFYYVMELADSRVESSGQTERASAGGAEVGRLTPQSERANSKCESNYSPDTLKSRLKRAGALPLPEVLGIAQSLATALDHLHSHGLVHRDIKPSNIIFVNGRPKLADIGLVTSTDATRSFVGTDGYIPPEGPGTPQADIYSLGKVLYECVTGNDRTQFPEIPENWRGHPSFRELLEFNEIVIRACDSEPRRRYVTASELLDEIDFLANQRGSIRRKRYARRLRRTAFVVTICVILFGLVRSQRVSNLTQQSTGPNRTTSTHNAEAQRLFQLARWHFNQNPGLGSEQAFSAINEALRLDPAFISAYILQFEMYVWRFRASPSEVATKTEQIAQKVLALDPSSGPAHAARAWSKHCTFQWNDAISELKTAIALAPDYPMAHVLYGLILTKLGRFAEARPQFAAALQLDPTSRMIAVVAGFPDYYSNSYTNAIVQFRNALELEPNSVYAYDFIVGAYERMGNYPAALTTVKDRRLRNGEDPAKVDSDLQRRLQAFRQFGPRGYWEDLYQDEFASGPNPNLQRLALVYVHLDEKQKALDCLERAFDTTTYTALWLKVDSAWDPIRAEPRFQSLLRRARFPE